MENNLAQRKTKTRGSSWLRTQEDPVTQRILSSFPHFNPLGDKCANVQTRAWSKKMQHLQKTQQE